MGEEKFRCHPSIILEKTGGKVLILLFLSISSFDDIIEIYKQESFTNVMLVSLGIIGLLCFILILNIITWYKTYIKVEENTIVIKRNTIISKENTFGIKNIANVNLEQNLFERLMGTYKIKIDTDSLSTANKTDIEIVLSKRDAYELKNKIVKLMNNDSSIENDEVELEYDIVYSVVDILKHCFYNLSLLKIMLNLMTIAFVMFTTYQIDEGKGLITNIIVSITCIMTVGKLFIGDLIKYYNFSIKREENKLYISYGLLKKNKFTVPVDRINSININQTLLSRVFKQYKCEIVTIGVGDDESEGSQILLSSKERDFMKNINILLPEFKLEEFNLQKQHKKTHIINVVSTFMSMAFISVIFYIILKLFDFEFELNIILLCWFGVFIFLVLVHVMSYITIGVNLRKDNLITSSGIFSRQISIVQYNKIQHLILHENPVSRRFNLLKCNLFILASLGKSIKNIGYYDKDFYEELRCKI